MNVNKLFKRRSCLQRVIGGVPKEENDEKSKYYTDSKVFKKASN